MGKKNSIGKLIIMGLVTGLITFNLVFWISGAGMKVVHNISGFISDRFDKESPESKSDTESGDDTSENIEENTNSESKKKTDVDMQEIEAGTVLKGLDASKVYIAGQSISFQPVGYGMESRAESKGDIRYIPYHWEYGSSSADISAGSLVEFTVEKDVQQVTVLFKEQECTDPDTDEWKDTNKTYEKMQSIQVQSVDKDVRGLVEYISTGTLKCDNSKWYIQISNPMSLWVSREDGGEAIIGKTDIFYLDGIGDKSPTDYLDKVVEVKGYYYEHDGLPWIKASEITANGKDILNAVKDDGYTGHTYRIVRESCSWQEAFQRARSAGGYLVHFDSEAEFQDVISKIRSNGMETDIFWIGATRDNGSRDYKWINQDGSYQDEIINSSGFWGNSVWLSGEPSFRDTSINEDEFYVEMFYYNDGNRWVWNDVPNDIAKYLSSRSLGYIIEFDAADGSQGEGNGNNGSGAVAKAEQDEKTA